jgi:ribosomal protein S15P/S13E
MPKKSDKKESMKEKKEKKPENKKLSKEEYEAKVLELAQQGLTSEKIGEALRKENIHPKEHKLKISRILRTNKNYIQPDLKNITEKLEKLRSHAGKNKQDKRALREVVRVAAQLRKFNQYYKVN